MFRLTSLISLTYQEFGQMLDASGKQPYRKIMLALGVETDKELAHKLRFPTSKILSRKQWISAAGHGHRPGGGHQVRRHIRAPICPCCLPSSWPCSISGV
jgi:hypothetical protein